jgi:hypothetical protein
MNLLRQIVGRLLVMSMLTSVPMPFVWREFWRAAVRKHGMDFMAGMDDNAIGARIRVRLPASLSAARLSISI